MSCTIFSNESFQYKLASHFTKYRKSIWNISSLYINDVQEIMMDIVYIHTVLYGNQQLHEDIEYLNTASATEKLKF